MKKKRGKQTKRSQSSFKKLTHKLLKISLAAVAIVLIAFSIFVWLVSSGSFGPIPGNEELSSIKNNLATEIYSEDGKVIGRYFLQQRTPTRYENISSEIIDALVATEDARFYSHNGVDYRSLLRVLVKTVILQDRSGGGGSTISQQLAKNLFPRENHDKFYLAVRKVKESIIAYRLENLYSKEEILTLYLNTVPFGENIFGIEMASKRFFSKKASNINAKEAAVLVGMLKANHTYNPRLFPENATSRRNVVLSQMNKYGYLSDDSLNVLSGEPLDLNYRIINSGDNSAAYLREQLRTKVEAWCAANTKPDGSNYNMYTDGLKIYTTIDSRLQKYAEKAVNKHLKSLQNSFDRHWGNQEPWSHNPSILIRSVKSTPHYQQLESKGFTHDEIMQEFNNPYPMKVFTWEGEVEKQLSPLDSVKHYLSMLQTGVVALNPRSGAIKTWIGGINFDYFKYDHVKKSTKRQVGSTFKPFVYAAALESGADPCELVPARKTVYKNLANWSPDNADTTENELKYSYKGALTYSVNTVSVKVLEDVGIDKAIGLAKNMGVENELPEVPSIALGTADLSLIEMVTTYSAFANGGNKVSPYLINRIEDNEGNVLYEAQPRKGERVMSENTAQLINAMLQSVVDQGTAGRLRWKYKLSNDLAGKTGTTQSNADGWFIGYNPELVMGVWVGADNPGIRFRSTALGSGANMALPIFGETFSQIRNDKKLRHYANSNFQPLTSNQKEALDCELYKEDKNFFERLLNTDLTKKEKVKEFDDEKKKKKGLFKKIGDLFKKKEDN